MQIGQQPALDWTGALRKSLPYPILRLCPRTPIPILPARQETSEPGALLLADLRMAKSHGRPHVVYQAAFAYRPRHRQLESIVSPERLD